MKTEDTILPKEFTDALLKDPDLVAKLQRRVELNEFKEQYSVERATPLKCPACSGFQMSGGSLWINKEDRSIFVCRKCKLQWKIECLTLPTNELIIQMKEINKGGSKE